MITLHFLLICDQNQWPFQNSENSHFSASVLSVQHIFQIFEISNFKGNCNVWSAEYNCIAEPNMFSQQLKANERFHTVHYFYFLSTTIAPQKYWLTGWCFQISAQAIFWISFSTLFKCFQLRFLFLSFLLLLQISDLAICTNG